MSDAETFLSNRTYDALKYLAQITMPAVGTLYFALSQIWGLPYGEEIVGTIVALNAFLGVLLGISSKAYNNSEAKYDGVIDIIENEERVTFSLNMDGDPYELEKKDQVIFRINSESH